jgi:hypothetical protein
VGQLAATNGATVVRGVKAALHARQCTALHKLLQPFKANKFINPVSPHLQAQNGRDSAQNQHF